MVSPSCVRPDVAGLLAGHVQPGKPEAQRGILGADGVPPNARRADPRAGLSRDPEAQRGVLGADGELELPVPRGSRVILTFSGVSWEQMVI